MVIHGEDGNKAIISPDENGIITYRSTSNETLSLVTKRSNVTPAIYSYLSEKPKDLGVFVNDIDETEECTCKFYDLKIYNPNLSEASSSNYAFLGVKNRISEHEGDIKLVMNNDMIELHNVEVCSNERAENKTITYSFENTLPSQVEESYSAIFQLPNLNTELKKNDTTEVSINIHYLGDKVIAANESRVLRGSTFIDETLIHIDSELFGWDGFGAKKLNIYNVENENIDHSFSYQERYSFNSARSLFSDADQNESLTIFEFSTNKLAQEYQLNIIPPFDFLSFHLALTTPNGEFDYSNHEYLENSKLKLLLSNFNIYWQVTAPLKGNSSQFDIIDVTDIVSIAPQGENEIIYNSYSIVGDKNILNEKNEVKAIVNYSYIIGIEHIFEPYYQVYSFVNRHLDSK